MPKKCFTPGQAKAPRWLCIRVGRAVEWLVRQDYCFDRGGCDEFQLGGSGIDFFDENYASSGTTRCRFLARYFVTHHIILDETFIIDSCEVRKKPVDPGDDENDRFAIPDIITDAPGLRTEFYEVKPNSTTGLQSGREKIDTFLSLIDFLKNADPEVQNLTKGKTFSPNRSITFYRRLYLGFIPVDVQIHYFLLEEGLIVYDICVQTDDEFLEALCKAIVVGALIAMCYVIFRALPQGGDIRVPIGAAPPILAAMVGREGVNDTQDVRYVQALLNDWLDSSGGQPIAMSDAFSEEMVFALSTFQERAGLEDTDGTVTPNEETIVALQQAHLENMITNVDTTELGLADAGSFIMQESLELVDIEGGDEQVSQILLDEAARQYLQAIHDNV